MILNKITSRILKYITGLLLLSSSTTWANNNCCSYFSMENWYLAGAGSIGWHNNVEFSKNNQTVNFEFETGWDAIVALGLNICPFRLEIEGSYRRNNFDSVVARKETSQVPLNANSSVSFNAIGHVNYWNLMLNGYFDYCIREYFSVYLGAGFGATRAEFHAPYNKGCKKTQFAWQIMPGLAYSINCQVTLFTEYRLFSTSKLHSATNSSNREVYLNNIELGVRVNL